MKNKKKSYFEDYDVIVRCGPTNLEKSDKELIGLINCDIKSSNPKVLAGFCNKTHTQVVVVENNSGVLKKSPVLNLPEGNWWFGEQDWNGGLQKPGTNLTLTGELREGFLYDWGSPFITNIT